MRLLVPWRPRGIALVPCGLAARGPVARALAQALLGWSEPRLAALRACAGDEALVVLGEESALPWIDGACYLGRDPGAPSWVMPTNRAPAVPMSIFAEALAQRLPGAGPWAVVPAGEKLTVFGLAAAAPIARARLLAWVTGP